MRGELAGDSTCPLDLPETRRVPLFVVSPKHTTDKQNKQPFLAWRQQPPPNTGRGEERGIVYTVLTTQASLTMSYGHLVNNKHKAASLNKQIDSSIPVVNILPSSGVCN